MDIVWMLTLGAMHILCFVTGARIAGGRRGRRRRWRHRTHRERVLGAEERLHRTNVGAAIGRPSGDNHHRGTMDAPLQGMGEKMRREQAPALQGMGEGMGCGGRFERAIRESPLRGGSEAVAPERKAPWEAIPQSAAPTAPFAQGGLSGGYRPSASPRERQLETILHNIERYDGTAAGQKEVSI